MNTSDVREIFQYKRENLKTIKKGIFLTKKIGKKKYPYLQWREGKKVRSEYINEDELEGILKELELRHKWEDSIKNLHRSIKQIERALGKEFINEYAESL